APGHRGTRRGDPVSATGGAASEPPPEHEQPIRELADLRQVNPPAALVARVMTKVADPAAPTFWRWMQRPFRIEIRMSPLGLLPLCISRACAITLVVAPRRHPARVATLQVAPQAAPTSTAGPARGPVVVRFMLEARGAKRVAVAGSFNDWD